MGDSTERLPEQVAQLRSVAACARSPALTRNAVQSKAMQCALNRVLPLAASLTACVSSCWCTFGYSTCLHVVLADLMQSHKPAGVGRQNVTCNCRCKAFNYVLPIALRTRTHTLIHWNANHAGSNQKCDTMANFIDLYRTSQQTLATTKSTSREATSLALRP